MKQIAYNRFSYAILLVSNTSKQSVSVINTREVMSGRLTRYITRHHIPLLTSPQLGYLSNQHLRHAMIVGRILRETLRIRYLVFGSTVYAGYYIYTLQKKYQQWKERTLERLPNLTSIGYLIPNKEQWHNFYGSVITVTNNVVNKIKIDNFYGSVMTVTSNVVNKIKIDNFYGSIMSVTNNVVNKIKIDNFYGSVMTVTKNAVNKIKIDPSHIKEHGLVKYYEYTTWLGQKLGINRQQSYQNDQDDQENNKSMPSELQSKK